MTVSRCSSARRTTAASARSSPSRISTPASRDLQGERRVEDVRGRQPVVEPAALRARAPRRPRRRTRRRRAASAPRSRRRARASAARRAPRIVGRLVGRHDADLGPAVERRELDLEPACELALVRPDRPHGRAGVAGDHRPDSRGGAGVLRRKTLFRHRLAYVACNDEPAGDSAHRGRAGASPSPSGLRSREGFDVVSSPTRQQQGSRSSGRARPTSSSST